MVVDWKVLLYKRKLIIIKFPELICYKFYAVLNSTVNTFYKHNVCAYFGFYKIIYLIETSSVDIITFIVRILTILKNNIF